MITDKLSNASIYYKIGKEYEAALKWLEVTDLASAALGRHEIQGDDIFAIIQEYDAKPLRECTWESHKLYADIQYIISGSELMGYAPVERLVDEIDHTPEKDVINYTDSRNFGVFHNAEKGDFFIFFPHDGHCPCIKANTWIQTGTAKVKKAVIKIKV